MDKDFENFLFNFLVVRVWVFEEGGKWKVFEFDDGLGFDND